MFKTSPFAALWVVLLIFCSQNPLHAQEAGPVQADTPTGYSRMLAFAPVSLWPGYATQLMYSKEKARSSKRWEGGASFSRSSTPQAEIACGNYSKYRTLRTNVFARMTWLRWKHWENNFSIYYGGGIGSSYDMLQAVFDDYEDDCINDTKTRVFNRRTEHFIGLEAYAMLGARYFFLDRFSVNVEFLPLRLASDLNFDNGTVESTEETGGNLTQTSFSFSYEPLLTHDVNIFYRANLWIGIHF